METPTTPAPPARAGRELTEADKDRVHAALLRRCEVDELTDCWVFTGAWDDNGHGVAKVGGRIYQVARLAAWVYLGGFGLDDRAVKVKQACQVPACFNPDHLQVLGANPPAVCGCERRAVA